jgi:uncharacterized protein YndB with AHSA1/START domain
MEGKIDIQIDVEAPPSRVFQALAESKELEQWFAEKAFVSPGEKRYDFWGRFTPEAPGPEAGRHRLLAFEPPARLGFNWRVRGEETAVEIRLEKNSRGTALRLTQEVPGRPKTQLSLGDFWALSLENLRHWIKNGTPPVRCDYSSPPRGEVKLALEIEAEPQAVFRGLTRTEDLDRWISAKAEIEPEVGGRFTFGWVGEGPVKILDLVPNQRLSYSWHHEGEPDTIVTWTLEGSSGRTRLLLVHSGFQADRESEDFRTGWLKHVLWLKALLEEGPSWRGPNLVSADQDEV